MRRSYAILGLAPEASLSEVRRRYRFLARRWHPDRHAGDQRNQSEADAQMQRINDAYHSIVEGLATQGPHNGRVPAVGRRLSPDEVDALAKAIGNEGPIDWLLGTVGWMGGTLEGIFGILCCVGFVARLMLSVWQRDFSVFREHPDLILLGLCVLLAGREYWTRSRILQTVSERKDAKLGE